MVRDPRKVYRVPEREAGFGASLRSLVHRAYREVRAVDGISFQVMPGEVVGFLGPNGAGRPPPSKCCLVCSIPPPAMGRFPVGAYPLWLRRVLTFVVPVALVTTVPAEALTGRLAPMVPLVSALTAILMVWLSTRL